MIENIFSNNYNSDIDDKTLVELAKQGKLDVLEALVIKHQSWIYNISLRMVGSTQDAEDITQEILIKIITRLSTFKGHSNFRTWLYRIVTNYVLNMKRKKREYLFSSLVKLLLGIYQPVKGKVEIAELDTRLASLESISKDISAVFQKYQRYKMSLSDNIEISNFKENKNQYADAYPRTVEESFKNVGLDIDSRSFPDDFNTVLSREFDGVELSLGQWQRIAIARGLYRIHDFIILDEPTVAIDPIEEANIYRKFAEISRDKTAVIITHRLGSIKMADRIVVMDSGKIVEMGTHEELMEAGKLYWKMFISQAK